MPIGEFPILEVIVRQLARCGFSRITMAVNHQAELIKRRFPGWRQVGTANRLFARA
jgi:NDP-sugar pyrophosphorylase family protein